MPTRWLVLFARAPRLGAVKSRLARDIGPFRAWQFYRGALHAAARRLAGPGWRTVLAVSPDRFARTGRFWPPGLPRRPQGGGDLGARMERVMRELPPGPVVIVGTDVPDSRRAHVAAAFRALGTADAVFGPAVDGGYWLVGLRRRPHRPRPFAPVRWSGPHALADTLANLGAGCEVTFLERLQDVDTGEDYRRLLVRRR